MILLPHYFVLTVVVIMVSMLQDSLADCPWEQSAQKCSDDRQQPSFGDAPTYLSLCSCIASMLGSFLVVIPFLMWKDVRSGLRRIVTFLAIADFFTAAGYTLASFNYMRYRHHRDTEYVEACKTFSKICQIQAYISSWASLSSFWWTAILAFYLYMTITKGQTTALNKWFPLFHVLAWGSPMIVMLPLLCTGSLGYSLFSAGGWCFISNQRNTLKHPFYPNYQDFHSSWVTFAKILAGGKAVEILTYVWVVVLYGKIYWNLRKKKKLAAKNNDQAVGFVNLLNKMEKKLYVIPVAFILVRIWGTLQFIFTTGIFYNNGVDEAGCVANSVYYALYFFACIQSIGDGAQGWCNAILYILMSPKIRMRLLGVLLNPLCNCLYDTMGLMHSTSVRQNINAGRASSIQYNGVGGKNMNGEGDDDEAVFDKDGKDDKDHSSQVI